jgi:hypothetical protein
VPLILLSFVLAGALGKRPATRPLAQPIPGE